MCGETNSGVKFTARQLLPLAPFPRGHFGALPNASRSCRPFANTMAKGGLDRFGCGGAWRAQTDFVVF